MSREEKKKENQSQNEAVIISFYSLIFVHFTHFRNPITSRLPLFVFRPLRTSTFVFLTLYFYLPKVFCPALCVCHT